MNIEQSFKWQNDIVSTYIASLRASLGDSVNEAAIDAMEQLYRAGWNDCYRHILINKAVENVCGS